MAKFVKDWLPQKNPSRILRLAKEGPVLILKGNEPDAVPMHLAKSLKDTGSGMRPVLAASLYRDGNLSLWLKSIPEFYSIPSSRLAMWIRR